MQRWRGAQINEMQVQVQKCEQVQLQVQRCRSCSEVLSCRDVLSLWRMQGKRRNLIVIMVAVAMIILLITWMRVPPMRKKRSRRERWKAVIYCREIEIEAQVAGSQRKAKRKNDGQVEVEAQGNKRMGTRKNGACC